MTEKVKYTITEYFLYISAALVRFIGLSKLPLGVYVDEPPLAYNAWCIANYGVDRYLNEYPIYPQNWYGGQSPMYTYILALLYKLGISPSNIYALRLPCAVFSLLTVIFAVKIAKLLTDDRKIHLLTALLVGFMPFYILQGRYALDCNLLLGCITVAFFFLIKYVKNGKVSTLVCTGFFFGLSMYSYGLSYILLVIFLPLCAIYLFLTKKINIKKVLLWAIVVFITAFPIVLFARSLIFILEPFKFLGMTIAPVAKERMSDISADGFLKRFVVTFITTLTSDGHASSAVTGFNTLYPVGTVFALLGMVSAVYYFFKSFKSRENVTPGIMLLLLFANLCVGGMSTDCLIYRFNSIYVAYGYFTVLGIVTAYRLLKSEKAKKIYSVSVSLVFAGLSVWFLVFYFNSYNVKYHVFMPLADEALAYAEDELKAEKIFVDYISLPEFILFSNPVSPYEWAEKENVGNVYSNLGKESFENRQNNWVYIAKLSDSASLSFYEDNDFERKDIGEFAVFYRAEILDTK